MTRRTTLIASTALTVLSGAACTGNPDAVDVPGADSTDVATDESANTTTASTEPAVAAIPTPTPAPTTTGPPPATDAPAAPEATSATEPAPAVTEGSDPEFLRQGDEGPRVGLIQFKLVTLGYLATGGDTAVFDAATSSAVLKFQGDYGLIVDGVIGPETDRAISAAAESINPEQT